jgi:hypothetical protein
LLLAEQFSSHRLSYLQEAHMNDPRSIAHTHVEAFGRKDFSSMERQFSPEVAFQGPGGTLSGRAAVLGGYQYLGPILLRNDVRKILVDGDDACIIYDFVTDTPGGAVSTVEWLRTRQGRIESIWLLFDRGPWPQVMEELNRRRAK